MDFLFGRQDKIRYGGPVGWKAGELDKDMGRSPKEIPSKDYILLKPGDLVTIELPGGGGYGNPENRTPELIEKDIRSGLITVTKVS
jgi:N-methylhydantoinase B